MVSLKNRSKGFTIVELLIVIVVIAILATLVIVTFTGIQQKARDSERQTDINALNSHLAAYFASQGNYPTLANLQDPTWVKANMKGLDPAALADPKTPSTDITATQTGIKDSASDGKHYGYVATPANCDNGTGGDCTAYTLTANLESSATDFTKSSNT